MHSSRLALCAAIALAALATSSTARAQFPFHPSLLEMVGMLFRQDPVSRYDTRIYPVISYAQFAREGFLRSGDYNSDGLRDVLVVIPFGGQCVLMRNEGGGAFLYSHGINDRPSNDGILANVDSDPDDEIVVIEQSFAGDGSSILTIFDRDADGYPVQSVELQGFPDRFLRIRAAEVTGDAFPDLVVLTASGFRVFAGDGDGQFAAQPPIEEMDAPGIGDADDTFLVRDVTGDTKPDLLWSSAEGGLRLRTGNGDGTFQPSRPLHAEGMPGLWSPYLFLDHEDDGDLDVVGTDLDSGLPAVAVNDGSGNFGTPQPFLNLGEDEFVELLGVADRTGDGRDDVLVTNGTGTLAYEQDASGAYQPVVMHAHLPFPPNTMAADFTDDGLLDVVFMGFGLSIVKGTSDHLLQSGNTLVTDLPSPSSLSGNHLAVGSIDNDTPADLVTTRGTVLFGDRRRRFDRLELVDSSLNERGLAAAIGDLNGDGLADLLFAVSGSIGGGSLLQIWLQTAPREFTRQPELPIPTAPTTILTGEFDGDGNRDVAILHDMFGASPDDRVSIHFGNGAGGIDQSIDLPAPPVEFSVGFPTTLEVGRGNRDDLDDLFYFFEDVSRVTFQSRIKQSLILGATDRAMIAFQDPVQLATGSFEGAPSSPTRGDVNGDGRDEVVLVETRGARTSAADGSFLGQSRLFPIGALEGNPINLVDVSGDGKADLLSRGSFPVTIYDRIGTSAYGPGAGYYTPVSPWEIAPGDFDGDGRLDIATWDYDQGRLGILYQPEASIGTMIAEFAATELATTELGARLENLVELHGEELRTIVLADARDGAFTLIEALVDELIPPLVTYGLTGSTEAEVTPTMAANLNALLDFLASKARFSLRRELEALKTDLDAESLVGLPLEFALTLLGGTTFRLNDVFWRDGTVNLVTSVVPQTIPVLERFDPAAGWITIENATLEVTPEGQTLTDPTPQGPNGIYRVKLLPE